MGLAMKTAKDYLDAANAEVPRAALKDAIAHHEQGGALFIDVRDSGAIATTGTIAGAARIPRGFLEFAADASTPHHNPVLQKDAEIYLVCGAGGQAALAGKTLMEMGFSKVQNVGGFSDWKAGGGPVED
jgi:rhodanese-related sulfurtransferase